MSFNWLPNHSFEDRFDYFFVDFVCLCHLSHQIFQVRAESTREICKENNRLGLQNVLVVCIIEVVRLSRFSDKRMIELLFGPQKNARNSKMVELAKFSYGGFQLYVLLPFIYIFSFLTTLDTTFYTLLQLMLEGERLGRPKGEKRP